MTMIAYHGTTEQRARRIFEDGFLPLPPSERVWFAESRAYAMGRAKTQARRANDSPVVLVCDIDLGEMRRQLGDKKVAYRRGIIAIRGPVPVRMLCAYPYADTPTIPKEVAAWLTDLLGLGPDDAVRPNHPGVDRLSRWINSRLAEEGKPGLGSSELLEKAKRWLPEHLVAVDLSPKALQSHRRVGMIDYEVDLPRAEETPRGTEALTLLDDIEPTARARGLAMLAEVGDPDLFDWCAMFLDDDAPSVRLAALEAMQDCTDVVTEVIEPLAASDERRIRAAAVGALAKHAGESAHEWIKRGLGDPEPSVRVAAARHLDGLDPRRHRDIFERASHDPNPDIAAKARRLITGK